MMRFLLLLLVTHTRAAPLDPQVEQRELHNEAKAHHRFAAWAESHGWHQDGPHHEQKSEHKDERDDTMLSAASFLTATLGAGLRLGADWVPGASLAVDWVPGCGGACSSDEECIYPCLCLALHEGSCGGRQTRD